MSKAKSKLLSQNTDWTFGDLEKAFAAVDKVAAKFKLNPYPAQVEIISSDQMLEAYASNGLPIMYSHWSFGKNFENDRYGYEQGTKGLAYEIVANTDPAIAYLMENNTYMLQVLTYAHACISGDTEYLTRDGWKRIESYTGGEVAQYNADRTINFVTPKEYIKREQDRFIHITGQSISQAVTDDHRVVYVDPMGALRELTGKEVFDRQHNKTRGFNGRFITGFLNDTNKTGMALTDDEIKLRIAIKADGSYVNGGRDKLHHAAKDDYQIRFHLKKTRKIDRLEGLLNNLNLPYSKIDTYDGRVSIKFRYGYISKKYNTQWYKASLAQLNLISEELLLWDGCVSSSSFSSNNKEDIDFTQFVWASLGYKTHISKNCTKENTNWSVRRSINNLVGFSKNGRDGRKSKEDFKYIDSEDGFAYCFSVPSGMFVIRHKDRITVTGNCHGHSHFFKNNYLFKNHTDASSIIDYLVYAKNFIKSCEEKYGAADVENLLDAAHVLRQYGVDRVKKQRKRSLAQEEARQQERMDYEYSRTNELFQSAPGYDPYKISNQQHDSNDKEILAHPEENLLYFIEKHSPVLEPWEREIIRIIRKIAQYFFPQGQTQLVNEAIATFWHYTILNEMYDQGYLSDGQMIEFLESHTGVTRQLSYKHPNYSSINVYALGFAMLQDVKRMCQDPTEEDKRWFPDLVNTDWVEAIHHIAANFRSDSFVAQYLSPKVIRDFGLFSIGFNENDKFYLVNDISDDEGYKAIRNKLAEQYNYAEQFPDIQIYAAQLKGNRTLQIGYMVKNRITLDADNLKIVIKYISSLWGHPVEVYQIDPEDAEVISKN
jgi:stage V sporulation protein R